MTTILQTCQSISTVCGFERPTSVMSSTEQTGMELAALANECGEQIAECFPWQKLKRLETLTAGSTEYDLPDDYGWMPLKQQLRQGSSFGAVQPVMDHDRWLELTTSGFSAAPYGQFTILNDQIVFLSAPSEDVSYYYVSNLWAVSGGGDTVGENQNGFLLDEDTFRLKDTLLRLLMIWKWKAYHGQPYSEEMTSFEMELAKNIMRERQPQIIAIGRGGPPRDYGYGGGFGGTGLGVSDAFPYTLPFDVA